MKLPVSLEYDLGADAHTALAAACMQGVAPARFGRTLLGLWPIYLGLVIGAGCAIANGFAFVACMIAALIGWLLILTWRSVSAVPAFARARHVRLDIADFGMTEHDEGVQAFMPWHSMYRWKRQDRFLIIELRNYLNAIIADRDVNGQPINLEEITNLLLEHAVKERK